jgi:hypothetical protein
LTLDRAGELPADIQPSPQYGRTLRQLERSLARCRKRVYNTRWGKGTVAQATGRKPCNHGMDSGAQRALIEFDSLSADQVDRVNAYPLAVGTVKPVKGLPIWRCAFRADPPLSKDDIARDVHVWAASVGIPFRKMIDQ